MSNYKISQSINLPQLQNLIKRDPESYRDEVFFSFFMRSTVVMHSLDHVFIMHTAQSRCLRYKFLLINTDSLYVQCSLVT